MANWEGKPTLASVLKGYAPSTESPLADPIKEHFRTLPAQLAANQAALDSAIAGWNKTDFATGQANPNYRPEAIEELTQIMPNMMGSTAIYHGTTPEAAANIAKRGFNVNKSADGTIWFTTNPEIGEVSATGKGAVVKRLLDEEKLKLATPEQADKYFIDQLIADGYEGVKYPGYGADEATHYQIFNPKKLGKETTRKEKIAKEVEKILK